MITPAAMSQASGKGIMPATVAGHIFTALSLGKPVPLRRLAEAYAAPTVGQWRSLVEAEAASGLDVVALARVPQLDLLGHVPAVGADLAAKEWSERTEDDKALLNTWWVLNVWLCTWLG